MSDIDLAPAITAGFSFGEAILALITKALPSDQQKIDSFKARYPKIYLRTKISILKQMFRYMKHHNPKTIEDFVSFVGGEFTSDEKQSIINMLHAEFDKSDN